MIRSLVSNSSICISFKVKISLTGILLPISLKCFHPLFKRVSVHLSLKLPILRYFNQE
nr:MAG TPA: hypothetical protein [Caudoviricetes sp.]